MGLEVIAAVASTLIAGAGVAQSRGAQKDARQEGKKAEKETLKLEDEKSRQLAENESRAAAEEARKKQRTRSLAALGRRGTLLTGPLGIDQSMGAGGKDTLG